MERPLGKNQLDLLGSLGSPRSFLIVGDKVAQSLQRRGLIMPQITADGFFQITPNGLRALADAWEHGRIEFPPPRKKQAAD